MAFVGFTCYLCVCLANFVNIYSAQEEKVSDACHGAPWINKAYNNLTCAGDQQVNITRVLMYQVRSKDVNCRSVISNDDSPNRCCVHDDTRCTWDGAGENSVARLQARCEGIHHCRLRSATAESLGRHCLPHKGLTSNIRSVRYTCINKTDLTAAKGNNSVGHTPAERSSPETSPPHFDQQDSKIDIGVIVGAALGALAMICITIIVVVVLVKRSERGAEKQPITNGEVNRVSVTNPNYFDVVYSEATDPSNIYSKDTHSEKQSSPNGEFELYSNVYDNEGDYAELSDFTHPSDKQTTQEYSHFVGELPASFPTGRAGSYDHVASDSPDPDSNYASGNETDTFQYFQVKGTYDSLDASTDARSLPDTKNKEVEDSYNVLGRTVVSTAVESTLGR